MTKKSHCFLVIVLLLLCFSQLTYSQTKDFSELQFDLAKINHVINTDVDYIEFRLVQKIKKYVLRGRSYDADQNFLEEFDLKEHGNGSKTLSSPPNQSVVYILRKTKMDSMKMDGKSDCILYPVTLDGYHDRVRYHIVSTARNNVGAVTDFYLNPSPPGGDKKYLRKKMHKLKTHS